MAIDLTHRLTVLLTCTASLGAAIAVGAKIWTASARKRGPGKLSLRQRFVLGLLLAAIFPAWWYVDQSLLHLSVFMNSGPRHDISDQLDVPPPTAASFDVPQWRMIGDRRVLLLQTPARVEWEIHAPTASLKIEYGFDPTAFEKGTTNGADFVLELVGPHGPRQLLRRRLDPRSKPEDRGPQTAEMIIPAFEEGAKLVLRTEPGDGNDTAWDWVCLYSLKTAASAEYTRQQYPNFNRVPTRAEGDNSSVFNNAEGKPFLLLAAPSVLQFALTGSERTVTMDFGFLQSGFTNGGKTDGALFRVEVVSRSGKRAVAYERRLTPFENVADRELQHAEVPLPAVKASDTLVLSILPGANNAWDHTYVSLFKLD